MLETWDEAGRALLRVGDRVNRVLGYLDVYPSSGPGSIDLGPPLTEGAPFVVTSAIGDGDHDFQARATVSGTVIYWEWGGLGYGEPVPTRITYGVY